MTLYAVTGIAQGLDATEAAVQATDQALSQVGRARIALAFVAASDDYPVRQVVNGVSGLLSDTPLIGFSTPAQITEGGIFQKSIAVGLLVSDDVQVAADWQPGFDTDPEQCLHNIAALINPAPGDTQTLLVIADGLNSDSSPLEGAFQHSRYALAGCLSGGEISSGRGYQIGGSRYGINGLAAAVLRGNLRVGIGAHHGWQPVGVYTQITRTHELWVDTLDERRASDTYARLFGHPAREWIFPPLNHLVRLYPLGIERDGAGGDSLLVRSPIRVESDGGLRMNTHVSQGKIAYFLVSSFENCLDSARLAAQQALNALGGRQPSLALIFADIAWKMMMQAQPGSEIDAIQSVLGYDIPLIGGYTYGQIGRTADGMPQILNQHLQVVLFGE